MNKIDNIFIQKQEGFSNQCGKCSLNNLLGADIFNKDELNLICKQFSNDFINPHRHIFGGDYDANVLIMALKKNKFECRWLDDRKKQQLLQQGGELRNEKTIGFLMNREGKKSVFNTLFRFSGRHWLAVRFYKNSFYLLDSLDQYPRNIPDIAEFLRLEMSKGTYVMEVTKQ